MGRLTLKRQFSSSSPSSGTGAVFLILLAWNALADDADVVFQRMYQTALAKTYHQRPEEILPLLLPDGSFSDLKYGEDGSESFRAHGRRQTALLYHQLHGEGNFSQEAERCFRYITYSAPPNTDPNWWGHLIGAPLNMWKGAVLATGILDRRLILDFLDRYWVNTTMGPVWANEEEDSHFAGGNFGPRAMLGEVEGLVRGTYSHVHKEVGVKLHKELAERDPYRGNGVRRVPPPAQPRREPLDGGGEHPQPHPLESLRGGLRQRATEGETITHYGGKGLIHKTGVCLHRIGRHQEEVEGVLHRYANVVPDPEYALVGHRHFFYTDLSVHQRREYYASVRILSNRTVRPESWASGENIHGFFQADGFMTVLIDGGEFGTRRNEVFQVYDWARVPSVTNQYTTHIPGYDLNARYSRRFFNDAKFSGGVTDGVVGVASMVYNRPYVPLRALKSWFFFDDVIVVVGSAITLEPDHVTRKDVVTTLTQIVFAGEYTVSTKHQGELTLRHGQANFQQPSWIFHRNVSYVFLNGDERMYSLVETRSHGRKKLDVFTAWITHTPSPVNATLAYAVLPATSVEMTRRFFDDQTVQVVMQDENVHVVCHHPSKTVGASLTRSGETAVVDSCGGEGPLEIEVDTPCLVLAAIETAPRGKSGEAKIKLSVSDPQQVFDQVGVSVRFEGRRVDRVVGLPLDRVRGSSVTTVITV
ncbi:chondroitinase-AC-like isoform X2 [Macrobrachium nipponense]|uniref:chondroitinase-AC-like isoform X2 n=1 Tax=Macrobrachium nipponense TaxID=159736 RepID=UPI0030C852EC